VRWTPARDLSSPSAARTTRVYHKGYPINFRGRGDPPSIQFSLAFDSRRADIDVDYRSSTFP
jgi:hypothetical protein